MGIYKRRWGFERKTCSQGIVEEKVKKIKVLEMIDRPFLGGGQINLLALARFLDREMFEISVCSRGNGPLVETLSEEGIPHFPISFSKRVQKGKVIEIVALLDSHNFDILHTHGGVAGLYGRWSAHRCDRPPKIVHTLHGIHYLHYRNFFLKYLYIYLERLFSRFSDAVIFVSDADRERGRRFNLVPDDKVVLIKNGIDFDVFESEAYAKEGRSELGFESSGPVVGTVARLHRQKGLPYLFRAAKKIQESIPEATVWILGGGSLMTKFQKLRKKLDLEETVHLLGERKDVAQHLSRFDVFVLPSLWEGLPYSLLEAAALAKPVVATDIDGVREIIQNGKTGLLVAAKDPELLAQAAVRLLHESEYAATLGRNLKDATQREFSLSQMLQKTQDLYLKLAAD
jgi:glycosyltransferase involved in cell wall biosynthesis